MIQFKDLKNTSQILRVDVLQYPFLGGGFKYFLFSPLFGEEDPILTIIFFRWVETTN